MSRQDWRRSRNYRIWRIIVIRRDKVCQCCGTRKRRHVHHKFSASYFPELRFDPNNGVVLCERCHIHFFHLLFKGGTRKKCTEKDFNHFIEITKHYKGLK